MGGEVRNQMDSILKWVVIISLLIAPWSGEASYLAQLTWQELVFPISPPARNSSAFVSNPTNHIALLFGGLDLDGIDLNDLWITDGIVWMPFDTPHAPAPRHSASMAYDSVQQRAVLFGGMRDINLLGDTWIFNGADWSQAQPLASPSPRSGASMAYDAQHGLMVLFGGHVDAGGMFLEPTNETWTWDGANWHKATQALAPLPRVGAGLVYDGAHPSILLFGGAAGGGFYDDTWKWDGTSWVELHPAHHPAGRADFGLAFDEERQQVILFGGQSFAYVDTTETWAWDGEDWSLLQTLQSPPEELAYGAQLAYLPGLKAVVLYNAHRQKTTHNSYATKFSNTWALKSLSPLYLPVVEK